MPSTKTLNTPSRNNYFYGKLMDVHHFQMEQDYLNHKRWLLNRFSLGHGVLCGLEIFPTSDGSRLRVAPGIAIDKLGREVIVPEISRPFDPRQLTDECGRPKGEPSEGEIDVIVCLVYHECMKDMVPVLVGDCEKKCAYSTIQEKYAICIKEYEGETPPVEPVYNFENLLDGDGNIDYAQLVELVSAPCPDDVEEPCVMLGRIELPAASEIEPGHIDITYRHLIYSNALLFELITFLVEKTLVNTST